MCVCNSEDQGGRAMLNAHPSLTLMSSGDVLIGWLSASRYPHTRARRLNHTHDVHQGGGGELGEEGRAYRMGAATRPLTVTVFPLFEFVANVCKCEQRITENRLKLCPYGLRLFESV
jgi:hypothetical protein